jgi:hypothetical protein
MNDERQNAQESDGERLKESTVSPADGEEAQPFDEQVSAEEEPQEARGAPGSRDEGLAPQDTGPANRPQ